MCRATRRAKARSCCWRLPQPVSAAPSRAGAAAPFVCARTSGFAHDFSSRSCSRASLLLLAADKSFTDQVDYPQLEPGIYQLDGVVSRKKQLLPYLTHALARVKS